MNMSSPAPKSPEQSDKSKKYDRQLRLWGDHGQKNLENSKICLINATALGTEILKSLVLPGIGSFTIIDGEKVTEEDIGSNFFLDNDSVGTSRAQAATTCLLELNPDVKGDYIDECLENVMEQNQEFLKGFTVVIATALPEKVLIPLSKKLWEVDIPLFSCKSIGFLGYVRLQVKEHTVVEAHPDNENHDMRLDQPWPALKEYLDRIDVSALDKKERSHVPALIILYYFLQKYREKHNGVLPRERAQKEELKSMIRNSVDDVILEENFEEAIKYVNTCVGHTKIPPQIQVILDDPKCSNISQEGPPFWVMAAALRELVQSEGSLPVKGSLPDMAADTNSYINLQQIYQKRSNEQVEAVYRRVTQILRNLNQSQDSISEEEVKIFCKHASELYLIRGTRIADEYENLSCGDISEHLEDPDSLMIYYVILRGLDRFVSEFNAYPGQFDDQVEPDVIKLKTMIGKMLGEWGLGPVLRDERVHEICRYGGAELHSISAILGGCVAHEVIKLITLQYKPLNNTFIYDAITSTSATYRL